MVDTSRYNPSCYFDGPYIRLNFGVGNQWLWRDSDGVRSDKVGHWTEPEYLLGEVDRLWIEEVLSPTAAMVARSMVLTHRQICWDQMESERRTTLWDRIKMLAMGIR